MHPPTARSLFLPHQTDEIPIWGLTMSASVSPVAYSMAWEAPCDLGWVMRALNLFRPAGGRGDQHACGCEGADGCLQYACLWGDGASREGRLHGAIL